MPYGAVQMAKNPKPRLLKKIPARMDNQPPTMQPAVAAKMLFITN
jgi:hypothetical protein